MKRAAWILAFCAIGCENFPVIAVCGNGPPHTVFTEVDAGACGVTGCAVGWGNCDATMDNGCETPLTTDKDCGSCGSDCTLNGDKCSFTGTGYACSAACVIGEKCHAGDNDGVCLGTQFCCTGCLNLLGECLPGDDSMECGSGGGTCQSCLFSQCKNGACDASLVH